MYCVCLGSLRDSSIFILRVWKHWGANLYVFYVSGVAQVAMIKAHVSDLGSTAIIFYVSGMAQGPSRNAQGSRIRAGKLNYMNFTCGVAQGPGRSARGSGLRAGKLSFNILRVWEDLGRGTLG